MLFTIRLTKQALFRFFSIIAPQNGKIIKIFLLALKMAETDII